MIASAALVGGILCRRFEPESVSVMVTACIVLRRSNSCLFARQPDLSADDQGVSNVS